MATQAALILATIILAIMLAPVALRHAVALLRPASDAPARRGELTRIAAILTASAVLCGAVGVYGPGMIAPDMLAGFR